MIWIARHSPSKDPKFHQDEMLEGLGRSITALLMIFNRGDILRTGVFINLLVVEVLF